jgi:hypothetical protein
MSGNEIVPGKKKIDTLFDLPTGLVPLSDPERFHPKSLSDKINGKAELYLSAGFKMLEAQRFKREKKSTGWMEMYIYHMEDAKNAYAVFSSQRRDDAESIDLGKNAYKTLNALFWTRGSKYLEILVSDTSKTANSAARILAEAFNKSVPLESEDISPRKLFPTEGLDPKSFKMIPANVFGYEKLHHVFLAEYRIEGSRLTAFIARNESVDEAKNLVSGYHSFLLNFGGKDMTEGFSIRDAKFIEIMDTYEVVFNHGNYFAGVHEAEGKEAAIHLALKLKEKLKKVSREQKQ